MRLSFTFFDCAESALLVDFGPKYSKTLSLEILNVSEGLAKTVLPGLRESIPALSSLTVFYDPLLLPKERLTAEIEALCSAEQPVAPRGRTWEIPVAYGGDGGPDLGEVASHAGLTATEAASLHAAQLYQVYMLGFLPGFVYMGDLPEPLRLPRRPTPRARVPAGSVAIAAEMTAIYPLESPGGWHLIGSTPIALWDIARQDEPLLKPGDRVRFVTVSSRDAEELRKATAQGWRPEPAGGE
ncbi:MAG: 5-oxoprolinase subunit PxpB [Rhodomicrobium sp.]